jgi:hypothetical protein
MPLSDQARADIDELLTSMELLSDDDAYVLADLWEKEDTEARRSAWVQAKAAIDDAGLMKDLDRVRIAAGEWMQASSSDFQGIQGLMGSSGGPAGARRTAAPAFIDYAAAILAGDALGDAERRVLVNPFRSLTEDESES